MRGRHDGEGSRGEQWVGDLEPKQAESEPAPVPVLPDNPLPSDGRVDPGRIRLGAVCGIRHHRTRRIGIVAHGFEGELGRIRDLVLRHPLRHHLTDKGVAVLLAIAATHLHDLWIVEPIAVGLEYWPDLAPPAL